MTEAQSFGIGSLEGQASWEQLARASAAGGARVEPVGALAEWVVFQIGDELYGIEVGRVRQILRMQPITAIPRVPPEVVGILSLRGKIIQVMDMRMRLGRQRRAPGKNARILFLRSDPEKVCGLIVDEVHRVLRVPIAQLKPAIYESESMVSSLYPFKGRLISLLDVERIMELPE